ncbi:MAG: type II secretion system GspH family protein [Bacteroidales bacterium]|jgi:type II secretory pathway pseudopilin PulG|nr:type II secretion system GspH family protein [Bacteroidales bacterium]
MNKKRAVTYVEVILVLTLIGVISAITVPGLRKHSQRTENAKLAQKGYKILEDAIDEAILENGSVVDTFVTGDNRFGQYILKNYFVKNMNVAKACLSQSSRVNCFPTYKSFDGATSGNTTGFAVILTDGIAILGGNGYSGTTTGTWFAIDVNNLAEPNKEGVDVFLFNFGKFKTDCSAIDSTNGDWKFCPKDHAKTLMNNGWRINYW